MEIEYKVDASYYDNIFQKYKNYCEEYDEDCFEDMLNILKVNSPFYKNGLFWRKNR